MKQCYFLFLLLNLSCGSDNGVQPGLDNSQSTVFTKVVNLETDLPDCSEDNDGQLIYVQDAKEFRFCDSDNWSAIELSGKDGANGSNGIDGQDGSESAAGLSVYDAGNNKLGTFLSGNSGSVWIMLTDSSVIEISQTSGLSGSSQLCRYNSADCTGECRVSNSSAWDNFGFGPGNTINVATGIDLGAFSQNSIYGGGSCASFSLALTSSFATESYTPNFTFPVNLPMEVK